MWNPRLCPPDSISLTDLGQDAADHVVGRLEVQVGLGLEHGFEAPDGRRLGLLDELRLGLAVAPPPLDVMADADGPRGRGRLGRRLTQDDPLPVRSHVDGPPVAADLGDVVVADVTVVDPLEQLRMDGARLVGLALCVGRHRHVDRVDSPFDREGQDAVEEQPVPALEPLLDLGLVLAAPRDPLDQVAVVGRGEQGGPADVDARHANLARKREVLAVPQDLVVEERSGRQPVERRGQGEEHDLPEIVGPGAPVAARRGL